MLSEGMRGAAGSTHLMSDAIAIMGRSGVSNLPFLMKNFDELKEKGEKLGQTWSKDDVEAAERLQEEINSTGVAFKTMGSTLGTVLMPAVAAAVGGFNDLISGY
jgi:hypothetical protein